MASGWEKNKQQELQDKALNQFSMSKAYSSPEEARTRSEPQAAAGREAAEHLCNSLITSLTALQSAGERGVGGWGGGGGRAQILPNQPINVLSQHCTENWLPTALQLARYGRVCALIQNGP